MYGWCYVNLHNMRILFGNMFLSVHLGYQTVSNYCNGRHHTQIIVDHHAKYEEIPISGY